MSNEEEALQLSRDPKRLLKRLVSAKNCLGRSFWAFHKPWKFNFEQKHLMSKSGKFVLEWKTRRFPERPVSHENQQTSGGTVVLRSIKDRGLT